jgi:heptosyltransferase-1
MNILIVKMSAIGDVIHTLPALNALRRHFPEARITWLVEEAASSLVMGHEALDRVLVSRRKSWIRRLSRSGDWGSIREGYRFIAELRDTEYDLILDFQGLLKSGVLVGLARGKRKVGFGKGMEHMERSYLFLNERVRPVSMDHHALVRGLMLLEAIGVPADEIAYRLPIGEKDRERASRLLMSHGVGRSKPVVVLHPVAQWETKLWRSHRFAALADRLIKEIDAHVVFTGSENDRGTIGAILSHMKNEAVNLAGNTSLKTLAAIYEKSGLVISTDTGPMHLAAAVGTAVVALFGPTAPWRTGPYGVGHQVVRAGLECSPCFKRQCETKECMERISVEEVLEAVRKVHVGDGSGDNASRGFLKEKQP